MDEDEFVASEHDRLISAISKLDKTQHIGVPTRNEPTHLNSEFNLIKGSNKLDINNVVKTLQDTAHNVQISKKLKKSQDSSKVLKKPLEKPQAERIKRSIGYEETKEKVGRWDPVVARARTVDFVSFPIKTSSFKTVPTKEFLSKLKLKSTLEKELDEIDPPLMQEVEEEEEPKYPMSYEEMIEHRQHSAKIRALQSYKAAKAKRQGKIKSKKYHRILKKDKLKQQLKEFEELQQKDPEEALKKLEALEKARALERHTLRHKNTGKWAKSKLVRAKYDKEVRQELAEQLSISKNLTHKKKDDSTDEEVEENQNILDVTLLQDNMNPWMLKRSDKSNIDSDFNFGYKKYLKDKTLKFNADNDIDSADDSEKMDSDSNIDLLKKGLKNLQTSQIVDEETVVEENLTIESDKTAKNKIKLSKKVSEPKVAQSCKSKTIENQISSKVQKNTIKTQDNKLVATTNWLVEPSGEINNLEILKPQSKVEVTSAFELLESKVSQKVEKRLHIMRKDIEKLENKSKKRKKEKKVQEIDNLEYLKLKNQKVKPIIDEELLETNTRTADAAENLTPLSKVLAAPMLENSDHNIDPTRFIEAKPKYLNTALSKEGAYELDQLDDDEQVVPKVNIEEVFEEDDVVASFRQEKEDEINKNKPEDIDLGLPGWGSWGGKGVKAPKRKRNRFISIAPPITPRRDENKGGIIIKEFKDPKLSIHKVKDVPFPFTSVKEYEASIRAPISNTFVPEKAFKKLIKPSVFTKAGTIIDPMDEDELLKPKNKRFRNENVISLLGKNK